MSDNKIAELKPLSSQPDQNVISALEDALEVARKGDMRDVAIFGTLTGNDMYRSASFNDAQALLGALSLIEDSIKRGLGDNN